MSASRRSLDAVERHEQLERARAARAQRDRGAGGLLIVRWSSRVRISPRAGFEKTYEERLARTLRKIGPFVAVGDAFPRPLPEVIGHCQFVYFDADWTPRLLGERGAPLPGGDSERARALRCLAREFKIAWGPLWVRYVVYCSAFIAALAGLEALISSLS